MSEIKCTKDYFIFKRHPSNREIDASNLSRIKASLSVRNLMQFKPILVDKEMRVLDGQHRLEAAKQLGIDVYYQMDTSAVSEEIILINANQKKWGNEDYLNYYISKGNTEYLLLKEYCEKNHITLQTFIRVCTTDGSTGGRKNSPFTLGTFKFPKDEKLDKLNKNISGTKRIIETLNNFLTRDKQMTSTSLFMKGCIIFLNIEEVDLEIFLRKLSLKIESVHHCAEALAYVRMFKDIYNWRNKDPLV